VEFLVDPTVSEAKFNRELADFRKFNDTYREKGWWMLQAQFPDVSVVFASPKITPASVIFGVEINFDNYDLWPPSVRLANPFTRVPYTYDQLPSRLPRLVPVGQVPPGMSPPIGVQDLMVAHGDGSQIPFLCLPGTREYHDHPGHSGDSWLLHRGMGEGTLNFILSQLYKYGVEPINSLSFNLTISPTGFRQGSVPQ
jgi:hypothetical protein